jgi:hypothetical protein
MKCDVIHRRKSDIQNKEKLILPLFSDSIDNLDIRASFRDWPTFFAF